MNYVSGGSVSVTLPSEFKNKKTMKQKEVTLCGKNVLLSYCYATEIAYKLMSGHELSEFMKEVVECFSSGEQRMPDARNTIYLILASLNSYYEFKNTEAPVKDTDLMYSLSPGELGEALGAILVLRSEFYQIPAEDKKEGEEESKNV